MKFNLMTRQRGGPHLFRPVRSHYGPPVWLRRLFLYGSAALVALGLGFWSTTQVRAIETNAKTALTQTNQQSETDLLAFLVSSQLTASELAARGVALMHQEGRLADASLALRAASAKDPNFRDAAVLAGVAQLRRAEELWSVDAAAAESQTKSAAMYLEQARALDPIHAETFRFLQIAYTNLGQSALAVDAKEKAAFFGPSAIRKP